MQFYILVFSLSITCGYCRFLQRYFILVAMFYCVVFIVIYVTFFQLLGIYVISKLSVL